MFKLFVIMVDTQHKLIRGNNNMQETQIDPNTGFLDRYSCLQLAANLVDQVGESGQPLAALLYFFAWQAKYGSVSRLHV